MYKLDKIKLYSSLFILLFINFIFLVKYLYRSTTLYLTISITITLLCFLLFYKRSFLKSAISFFPKINSLLLFTFCVISVFIFYKIPVATLKVDRWSVITSFWDNYFNNKFVYNARSNMGNPPGPMPFYFILALPFYFIGELGYFSLLGIVCFYFFIKKVIIVKEQILLALLLTLSSGYYLWEVACRSNVFLNATLVLIVLYLFLKIEHFSIKTMTIIGILIGLVLSTRNVFIIPFIIGFIYSLKFKKITIKQTIYLGLITLSTFIITFMPFVWGHFEDFKISNPFIIQSSFLIPFRYTLLFISFSFFAGYFSKTKNDVYFFSALTLFISICFYILYWIIETSLQKTIFESGSDISYFILCVPFCLFSLIQIESEE